MNIDPLKALKKNKSPEPVTFECLYKDEERVRRSVRELYAQLESVHKKFESAALRLGPCDRAEAERAVSTLYKLHKLAPPQFLWFDSPVEGYTAMAILDVLSVLGGHDRGRKPRLKNAPGSFRAVRPPVMLKDELITRCSAIPRYLGFFAENMVQRGMIELGSRFHHSDTMIGSAETRAIEDVNQRLTFEQSALLTSKIESIARDLGPTPLGAACLDLLQVLSRLSSSEYGANITSHQHRMNSSGCLVWSDGYKTNNVVSAFDLYRLCTDELWSVIGVQERGKYFDEVVDAMGKSGWFWPAKEICIMIDRPIRMQFDYGRFALHNENGKSVEYADGWGAYSLDGIPVTERLARGEFSCTEIDVQQNSELRRVMIDRYGAERYLLDSAAVELHRDECGVLFRKSFRHGEPLVMVRVQNSTQEPDGSFKSYYLRVPPHMETAREAVAWTFQMQPDDYKPQVQS